ncbi:MAG: hypothetical protein ABI741_07570 [Ferruginibacter sp.]
MRTYFRKSLSVLLFSLLFAACNSTTEKNAPGGIKTDTAIIVNNKTEIPVKDPLKEIVLNEKTVITGKRLIASKKIDAALYRSLSIKMIDSTAGDENGFSYHVVDTLLSAHGIKVLLIGRAYESENFIWIVIYDNQNKLLDHKTVYYDNAEGFLAVETIIKNNKLTITTFNEYAETEKEKKKTEVYHLNENNFKWEM